MPFRGRDSCATAGAQRIPCSAEGSFQMVYLRGMSARWSDFGRLAQIRVPDPVHKADVALKEGRPREAWRVLGAVPTRVDLLYCVMVVADVFAQGVGGVEGLFTLPTWVPLQRLPMALFHVGHIALSIRNPLLALLTGPACAPQPGPCFSPAMGFGPAPAA